MPFENPNNKISQEAANILSENDAARLSAKINELKQYLVLRQLYEHRLEDLPKDVRDDLGTSDPMDEFIEQVGNFEKWDEMTEKFGYEPDEPAKWSTEEISELIRQLETNI